MRKPGFAGAAFAGLMALAVSLLAGCGPVLQAATPLDEVLRQAQAAAAAPYRLGVGDTIQVKHLLNKEYDDTAIIQPDGRVALPGLASSIPAAGLTTDELGEKLKTAYAPLMRDLQFRISIQTFANRKAYVTGEVQHPGPVELVDGQSLMQVLAASGGLLATARTGEVIIVRHNGQAAGEKPMIFRVDLDKIMSGQDLRQDVAMMPLDTVIVPRSDIANLDRLVEQYIRSALPVPTSAGASAGYSLNPSTVVGH